MRHYDLAIINQITGLTQRQLLLLKFYFVQPFHVRDPASPNLDRPRPASSVLVSQLDDSREAQPAWCHEEAQNLNAISNCSVPLNRVSAPLVDS